MTTKPPPVKLDPAGKGRIYESILDTIGNTPLIRVRRFAEEDGVVADLLLKLEFFNPLGSVKDRIALGMIIDMENEGRIEPGKTTLVEPTSGNTGIGLAFVAASRGYKLILTMPESMSIERRKMLALHGCAGRADAPGEGHARRDREGERIPCDHSRLGDAQPVRQPLQPGDPRPHHGGRNLEGHGRRRSTSSSLASAPAARSPAARAR